MIDFRFYATNTFQLVTGDLFGVSFYRMQKKILGLFQSTLSTSWPRFGGAVVTWNRGGKVCKYDGRAVGLRAFRYRSF